MNRTHSRSKPLDRRSLGSLISLYENNYFRLYRLVPQLDSLEGTVVSRVAGALDLYLTLLERQKYTTVISLTYQFPEDGVLLLEPNAKISVCHDVRTAEIISHYRRKRIRSYAHWQRYSMHNLHYKWMLNRFLQKWLGFCHLQGHMFLTGADWQYAPPPSLSSNTIQHPFSS